MPLPAGTVPLAPAGPEALPPAYLVRFPEDTWTKLAAAADGGAEVSLTVDGGITLNLPGEDPLPLDAHNTGQLHEVYSYSSGQLVPEGTVAGRLSVPFTRGAVSRAAEKVRQQSAMLERERAQRAERVTGKATATASYAPRPIDESHFRASPMPSHVATPMSRTQSGPATAYPSTERVPLKTGVVQLLALGPATIDQLVEGTGGPKEDVSRAANVIGRRGADETYTLRPHQYAKIKIAGWKYTYDEVVTVVALARKAFDEIGLPPDAEERAELDQKEKDALATAPRERSPPELKLPPKVASPPKPPAVTVSPPKPSPSLPPSRAESPAPAAASSKSKEKAAPKTKVGKQIAKMKAEHAKRASSLPNVKGVDRTASPRLGPSSPEDKETSPKAASPPKARPKDKPAKEAKEATPKETSPKASTKTKKASAAAAAAKTSPPVSKSERPIAQKRRASTRDYTSSDDSEEGEVVERDRGRARTVKSTSANGKDTNGSASASSKRRPSPVYTSSDDDGDRPKRRRVDGAKARDKDDVSPTRRSLPSFKRRVPAPLDLDRKKERANGHAPTPTPEIKTPRGGAQQPDARTLRDRYDELYPRYEKLSASLAAQYQAAERVRAGDGSPGPLMSESEVQNKVAQWEEWHRELEDIRAWFG